MPVDVDKPIIVGKHAAGLDALTATIRYLTVIVAAFPVILAMLKDRDIVAIHAYFTGADGSTFVAAAVGLGTLGYGLYKTFWRAAQVVTVARDRRVPGSVADVR